LPLPRHPAAADNVIVAAEGGFQALIERARKGDRQAVDRILELVRPHMEAVARGYIDPGRGTESTSDLVQEAWLRAWQKLDQFEGGKDDHECLAMFHGWVGQIVSRLGLNHRRDQNALKRSPEGGAIVSIEGDGARRTKDDSSIHLTGSGTTPSGVVCRNEAMKAVHDALERVGDSVDRTIVQLRFFEGVSLKEIAARLKLDYNSVRERYALLLVRLESILGSLA
jgi:RNA polymerase sigma factor (sigma-70 family)